MWLLDTGYATWIKCSWVQSSDSLWHVLLGQHFWNHNIRTMVRSGPDWVARLRCNDKWSPQEISLHCLHPLPAVWSSIKQQQILLIQNCIVKSWSEIQTSRCCWHRDVVSPTEGARRGGGGGSGCFSAIAHHTATKETVTIDLPANRDQTDQHRAEYYIDSQKFGYLTTLSPSRN